MKSYDKWLKSINPSGDLSAASLALQHLLRRESDELIEHKAFDLGAWVHVVDGGASLALEMALDESASPDHRALAMCFLTSIRIAPFMPPGDYDALLSILRMRTTEVHARLHRAELIIILCSQRKRISFRNRISVTRRIVADSLRLLAADSRFRILNGGRSWKSIEANAKRIVKRCHREMRKGNRRFLKCVRAKRISELASPDKLIPSEP